MFKMKTKEINKLMTNKDISKKLSDFEKGLQKYKLPQKTFNKLSNNYLFLLLLLRRSVSIGDKYNSFGDDIFGVVMESINIK